jgi:hypothetical protein
MVSHSNVIMSRIELNRYFLKYYLSDPITLKYFQESSLNLSVVTDIK